MKSHPVVLANPDIHYRGTVLAPGDEVEEIMRREATLEEKVQALEVVRRRYGGNARLLNREERRAFPQLGGKRA